MKPSSPGTTRTKLALAFALLLAAAGSPFAIELELFDGEVTGSFDTTVTTGMLLRTQDRDEDLIGVANGGTANSTNADDGNLNYGAGDPTSANARATHELLLRWRNFSVFARAFYFYDVVVNNVDPDRTNLGDTAKRRAGRRIQPLDAYGTADFDLLDMPLTVRFGNQVISWGESTFVPNGVNIINPVDVTLLRVPGAELRNALRPVPAVDVQVALTDRISVESFYQFFWEPTELEPLGTFFSTNDIVSPGGRFALLGFGRTPDDPVPPPGTGAPIGVAIPNGGDRDAGDSGQWGIAFRYFEPLLWSTEFGFYYLRYHSRLPLLSARTGTLPGLLAGDYARSARYFREFPEDIDLLAGSFSTELASTGIAVQGEVSYKLGQPLQVDDVELLYAGLTPIPVVGAVFARNQVGTFGFDEFVRGWRRKDVLQPQMTITKLLGPTFGADQVLLLAEFAGTLVMGLEDQDTLRYEGPGTFSGGDPFFTTLGIQPETQTGGFADARSWGYRLVVRPTFNRAIGAINLVPTLAFQHDVEGTTPSPIANFVEGRKGASVSVTGIYLEKITGEIGYTSFFDGGNFNLLTDRDFVSIAVSYSF